MLVITKYSYIFIITYVKISAVLGVIPMKVPRTPCPDKFLYKLEKNIWFADLKIVPPNFNRGYAVLQTNFSIGLEIPKGSEIGTLQLLENDTMLYEKIKIGTPLNYRVYFPYRNILPYLTAIVLNGQVICAGPEAQVLPRTSYYLIHTLTLITTNNNRYNEIPSPLQLQNPFRRNRRGVAHKPIPLTSKPQNNNDRCGINQKQSRHPWLVGLFKQGDILYKYFCSGSLISNKHVITAAHCADIPFKIFVKLGSKNVTAFTDPGSVTRYSKNVYTHPDYEPGFTSADISIILLNEEVATSPDIRPICLRPKENEEADIIGKLAQLVGWTKLSSGVPNENYTEINVIVNPLEECDKFDTKFLSDKTICAEGKLYKQEQCLDNSGGALIFTVNERQMLRGIVSETNVDSDPSICNMNKYYFLFIDITKYFDWINVTLRLV